MRHYQDETRPFRSIKHSIFEKGQREELTVILLWFFFLKSFPEMAQAGGRKNRRNRGKKWEKPVDENEEVTKATKKNVAKGPKYEEKNVQKIVEKAAKMRKKL